jgi:hypothetical protein
VFYGAAEFSRDLDLLILADAANFERIRSALADLNAKSIAVPPFDVAFLNRGHAVHFRCQRDDVKDLRIDLMSVLRTVAPFEDTWDRPGVFGIASIGRRRGNWCGVQEMTRHRQIIRYTRLQSRLEPHRGNAAKAACTTYVRPDNDLRGRHFCLLPAFQPEQARRRVIS